MKSRGLLALTAVAASAALGLSGCGSSSGSSGGDVAKAAKYSGSDRTQYLESCAKKEGSLNVYTAQNTDLWQALQKGFAAKYPDIKLNITRRTSDDTAEALTKEAQGGVHKADVVDVKVEIAESLLNLFAPYTSPEQKAYPKDAIGGDGKYTISDRVPYGIVYNTQKVPAADVPQTSEDLLKPEFKGKIAMSSTLLGTQWVGWMDKKYGDGFIQKFGAQDVQVTAANTDAIAAQVAAGESIIAPGINLSVVQALKAADPNTPVEWKPVDPQWTLGALALDSTAPHPCAAMLYIDYELSHAGQTVNPAYISARSDVPVPDQLAGVNPVDIWGIVGEHSAKAYQTAFQKWTDLMDRDITSH